MSMQLTSPAFAQGEAIPSRHTCDGEDISPELHISGVPEGALSLVLIMEDPDVPSYIRQDGIWDHWIVFNIPPDTAVIPEGSAPKGRLGTTTYGSVGYGGPCPPDGEHRYFFKLYALSGELDLPEGASKKELLDAMEPLVIESVELVGLYDRGK